MMVPGSRLLFWLTALGVSLSVLVLILPGFALIAGILAALFLSLALLDAALAFGRFTGLTIEAPEIIRLTQDRDGFLILWLRNPGLSFRRLRLALPVPREIELENESLDLVLSSEQDTLCVEWPCVGKKRGLYSIPDCRVETASPLGFWDVRATLPLRGEVRVYPSLAADRKTLAAIFLNRGGVGIHAQRQVGRGRDFEKLREYIPGDSYEDIHWKATAKRGQPVAKVYQVERTQEVYVILDASRLSARPSLEPNSERETTLLERYISAALVMGQVAERQGDLFGMVTFSDKPIVFLPARGGRPHFSACRNALYRLETQSVSPDFRELFSFLRLRIRRRALLVILTDLDDPALAKSFTEHVDLLTRQHVVLVNMLKPSAVQPLFSKPQIGTSPEPATPDDFYKRLGGHLQWCALREVERVLHRHGARFSLLGHESLCADLVSQYLNVKQRQLL